MESPSLPKTASQLDPDRVHVDGGAANLPVLGLVRQSANAKAFNVLVSKRMTFLSSSAKPRSLSHGDLEHLEPEGLVPSLSPRFTAPTRSYGW